jgi:predicted nucleotide-binding protein
VVNVYDKGTILVQGKHKEAIEELLGFREVEDVEASGNKVFVVYGHDDTARGDLENMLRRWGLDPILLDQLPSEGQTIIEKLEKYRAQARFAIVLATPDDEGHRSGHSDEKAFRARQNVVLELGMMLAYLGRSRVAILLKNVRNMERPSDIQGLIYIPFADSIKDAGVTLAKEMAQQGFRIDVKRL